MRRREVARELADWCTALRYDDIPGEVISRVRASMLDAAGCALGAAGSVPVEVSRRVAADMAPAGPCTLIGCDQRTNVEHAAFVNSVAIRYLDYCDVYLGLEVTPPASCASVIWALCEARGLDGRACLTGMVVLYESMLRLCSAASLNSRGWDTVTYQAIASAMAASRLLELTAGQAYEAINIAVTNAPALLQTRVGELSMWKGAASAYAARGGLTSALLAAYGMTGPREVFEGQHGLENQVTGRLDLPSADEWRSLQVLIKRFPAQVYTQSAIEAALQVRAQLIGRPSESVERVQITTFGRAIKHTAASADRWEPQTRESADHSLPFLVAAALIDGQIGTGQFTADRISAPDIRAMISRITVTEDPAMTAAYPGLMPARIDLHCRGQGSLSAEVPAHQGHPSRPMGEASLQAKFMQLAVGRLGEKQAKELMRLMATIESAPDIRAVTSMMTPA